MPTAVDRGELRRLIDAGAQLAEVLPKDEYDDEHLPSALHLPLKSLTPGTVAHLDRHRPIVVYCWDALRDMSPRAAWRLEHLGFREVYDYVPGKAGLACRRPPDRGHRPPEDTSGRCVGPVSPDVWSWRVGKSGQRPSQSRRLGLVCGAEREEDCARPPSSRPCR